MKLKVKLAWGYIVLLILLVIVLWIKEIISYQGTNPFFKLLVPLILAILPVNNFGVILIIIALVLLGFSIKKIRKSK